MESAFSYLAGLVDDVVGDVGKESKNKNDEYISPLDWDPTAICAIDAANSGEDYTFDNESTCVRINDMECQDHHQDKDYDMIQKSESNTSSQRKPNRKSLSSALKSKGIDFFQSFSREPRNPPPPLEKFSSSFSETDNETAFDADISFNRYEGNDDSDFDWANSLSNQDPQMERPREMKRPKLPPPPKTRHFEWWAHGIIWTCMAVSFGWIGVGFSFLARESTDFVTLREPMYLDPRYETIPSFGMIKLKLCLNDTHLDILEELDDNENIFGQGFEPPRLNHPSQSENRAFDVTVSKRHEYNDDFGPSVVDEATTPCIIHRMTSDDIYDDSMLQVAQSMTFLAMAFGGFVTFCLSFSIFWKTINLRPIGFGFLLAYFMQSFTFLIFDTNLCKDNDGCIMSRGGHYSIVASICWILSCAASSRMEKRKQRNEQKQIEIVEEQYREYFAQRKAARAVANRLRPNHITIQKESQPSPTPSPPPPKPKPLTVQNRAITAETTNETSDEDSSSSHSDEHQNILEDLKELNINPVYLPILPQCMPQKASSASSLTKKSDEPRSTSSFSNEKIGASVDTNIDANIENKELEKPSSTKSKSKKKKKNASKDEVERSKKSRSKHSKSKDKKTGKQDIEESSESQPSSASSVSSATLATNLEPVKERRSLKKMKESNKKGQSQQERPRSSRKSKKMDSAVDLKHDNSKRIIDDMTLENKISSSTIDSSVRKEGKTKKKTKKAQQKSEKENKQSSSRTRKSKDENSSSRTSLQESKDEGVYFEL